MKRLAIALIVLTFAVSAVAETAYTPSHTILGLRFGCTSADFLETVSQFGKFEVKDNPLSDNRTYATSDDKINYAGKPAKLFGWFTDDALTSIEIRYDGYQSKNSSEAAVKSNGFTELRGIYDELYASFGYPDIVVFSCGEKEDDAGNMIHYRVPVNDGLPDITSVLKIIDAGDGGSSNFLSFVWDNLNLFISYMGWKTKNTPYNWIYSCSISLDDSRDSYLDVETVPLDTFYGQIKIE